MKLQSSEVPCGKKCQTLQKTPKILILVGIATALFTVIPLYHPLLGYTLKNHPKPPSPIEEAIHHDDETIVISTNDKCDIFTGEWVPNPNAPYYTNASCWAIYEHLNCAKYGRPDTEFLKWRWRPDGCEMGVFNPFQFLDIVRNKTMVFVGDSVARNQLQSMICLLSPAEWPVDVSYTTDELFMRWKYMSYNFTMAFYTTPFLVKIEEDPNNPSGLYNLYLDEYDERWTNDIESSDYVIISAGHSFFRPGMYYENRKLVGCRYCQIENVVDLPMYYGYRRAFRTAFRAINNMEKFKGITFLRTFSPSHFEGGSWDTGGDCPRKRPWASNEAHLGGVDLEMYMTQVEEFRAAEREGKKKGKRFRLLDTTQAMYLRPDGHPSRYGHLNKENETVYNDCENWCLPGPIDTWADFLLDMLKKEGKRSHEELLLFQRQSKAKI